MQHSVVRYFTLSGGKRKWRNDGRCGSEYDSPAECDPDGENPCCSHWWNGQCGNTTDHCSCSGCVDYAFVRKWRESGGKIKWRNDGKCGSQNPLPDGSPAECDPDGENPCCSDDWNGRCGNTTEHCSCSDCVDYAFFKEWRESGGKIKWRNDGRCGTEYRLPDDSPAECDPDGENPCCSHWWNRQCGNTTEYCSCSGCVDYAFVREWRESGGKIKWRNDGRCGTEYRLPDDSPGECDPDGESPCCSAWNDGRCGNTTEHCSCLDCVDYTIIHKEWRESGGKIKWRYDGRCGRRYRIPPAECDPDGENPCCSKTYDGRCGNTARYCSCLNCVDYSVIYREWRESGGKINWRYDGRCGSQNPLPDNSPAECDPDGESPCCSGYGRYGECGNTAEHCSCYGCVDHTIIHKEWRESEGKIKWRYDGKCGSYYSLPDNSPAECDPDGENPCCSEYGRCRNTPNQCSCKDCVNYRAVDEVRKSGENCTVAIEGGFLKNVCFDEKRKQYYFKCTHSDVYFKQNTNDYVDGSYQLKSVSTVCENDPHVYQACGLNTAVTNTDVLCGGLFCNNNYIRCFKNCSVDNYCSVKPDSQQYTGTNLCNDKCDTDYCIDESYCNGYKYGVTCTDDGSNVLHVPVMWICDGDRDCDEGEDEQDCYESYVTESYVTTSYVTESNVTESNVTESYVTESYVTESNVTTSYVTESYVTESNVTESYVTESNVTESYVTESNVTESYVTESDVTESYVTESYVTESSQIYSLFTNLLFFHFSQIYFSYVAISLTNGLLIVTYVRAVLRLTFDPDWIYRPDPYQIHQTQSCPPGCQVAARPPLPSVLKRATWQIHRVQVHK